MTLDGVDAVRISRWAHFVARVYPIYSAEACAALEAMDLPTPFKPDDIASYGVYVSRIEGLKKHAPAAGLPEIGLPEPVCSSLAWSASNEPRRSARSIVARRRLLGAWRGPPARDRHGDGRLAGARGVASVPHRRACLPPLAALLRGMVRSEQGPMAPVVLGSVPARPSSTRSCSCTAWGGRRPAMLR